MKIVAINMLHTGSTGKIMLGIAERARAYGHEVYTFSPNTYYVRKKVVLPPIKNHTYFGYSKENMLHLALSQATGYFECFSFFGTRSLIKQIDKIQPDIIHLHNLHNNSIDVRYLFKYIKKKNLTVVWTLHDCWSMTGKCPYFDFVQCYKWKNGCNRCPALQEYPKTYFDRVKKMWRLKKKWFSGVQDMTLVTPSKWLSSIVSESYMSNYPVKVINNGIDLETFCPTRSSIRQTLGITESTYIVLGVAFDWEKRKGLDVFVQLAHKLPSNYRIVLVGVSSVIERLLPDNIIAVRQTKDQKELAELYTAADVFVNPTREDNFPTVNLEALACGTPVITFDSGGSSESLDHSCGIVVACDDVETLEKSIRKVCTERFFSDVACISRAHEYDKDARFEEYLKLYEEITHQK